jgi:hypothetical protein
MKPTSALLGILSASLLPASVATGLIYALDPYATYHWMPLTWLVAFAVCLVHAVVLGVPGLWLLHRKASLTLRTALATGLLVGFLPTLSLQLLNLVTASGGSEPTLLQTMAAPFFTGILGAIGAWSFMYASGMSPRRNDA